MVVVEPLETPSGSSPGSGLRRGEHELDCSGGGGRMLLLPSSLASLTNGSNGSRHLLLMLNWK